MIISQKLIAKKYAKAYLNKYQDIFTQDDLDRICKAAYFLKNHTNFMLLLCAVGVDKSETTEMLDKFCNHFEFTASLQKLVDVLKERKHISFLREVLQDICALYKKRKNILELKIITANELDDADVKKIKSFVESQTRKNVVSSVQIDESLIAGLRLQSDFYLWDYSIASRLRSLQHTLFVEG